MELQLIQAGLLPAHTDRGSVAGARGRPFREARRQARGGVERRDGESPAGGGQTFPIKSDHSIFLAGVHAVWYLCWNTIYSVVVSATN